RRDPGVVRQVPRLLGLGVAAEVDRASIGGEADGGRLRPAVWPQGGDGHVLGRGEDFAELTLAIGLHGGLLWIRPQPARGRRAAPCARSTQPTKPAARRSRSLIASPRPSSGIGATAMARAPEASAARRKAKRLAAASARSPAGLRFSVDGAPGPKPSQASPSRASAASRRTGRSGA